jgi:hypothetical protein
MDSSIKPNENNFDSQASGDKTNSRKQEDSKTQPQNHVEVIRALTPIFLALIGGVIGIAVLVTRPSDAGFGLASTAIAGAAGLAQPYKDPKDK